MIHKDYFGNDIQVGDVLLGAKAGGKFFDTVYSFVVVVSKTPKLLRVSQLAINSPEKVTKDIVIESLTNRRGRKAGRVHPNCFIRTKVNVNLTQAEMESAINKTPPVSVGSPLNTPSCLFDFI
jgi:hypothetical protein